MFCQGIDNLQTICYTVGMSKITDQYGNVVDTSRLVTLNGFDTSVEAEIDRILDANWYETEPNGVILVDFDELSDLVEDNDPADAGVVFGDEISKIDNILHRFDPIDGFYHA